MENVHNKIRLRQNPQKICTTELHVRAKASYCIWVYLLTHSWKESYKWYLSIQYLGCIHLLNTRKYCDNTCKYCGNTQEYWANPWKMWSPAIAILASIVTILVAFEAILKRFSVWIIFKSQFQSYDLQQALKHVKIASRLKSIVTILEYCTCRWTHFSSIWSILVSIIIILTSIVTILASIEQVNTPLE